MLSPRGAAQMAAMIWIYVAFSASLQAAETVDRDGDGSPDFDTSRLIVVVSEEGENRVDSDNSGSKGAPQGVGRESARARGFLTRERSNPNVKSLREIGTRGKRLGGKRKSRMYALEIDRRKTSLEEEMKRLSEDEGVIVVEPDFIQVSETNDPYFSSSGAWGQSYRDQWYLDMIDAPEAWDLVPDGAPEVVVAVIDSGVDRNHPDLDGVMWTNAGEIDGNGLDDDGNGFIDDHYGWNFASENNDTTDSHGHGTLLAGIIGAEQGNGVGIAGAAEGVRIMALRNGEAGTSYVSDTLQAIYYAVDHGAQVINMSFGGRHYSRALETAVQYANDHGVIMVASAGNSGSIVGSHYPSSYSGVISVGASDDQDEPAGFSNYGAAVDLVAPGGGGALFGGRTMLGSRASGTITGEVVDAFHVRSSGTSFSAPLVSAAAAMIRRQGADFEPEIVQQILKQSADDIGAPGWDLRTSAGRLNMARALSFEGLSVAEISSLANGQVVSGDTLVLGSAWASAFSGFELSYGAGTEPSSWIPISSGDEPVSAGVLGTFSADGLGSGDYVIRLLVLADGEQVGESRVQVYAGQRPLVRRDGWPVRNLINSGTPTLVDLDGDDLKEVIMATSRSVRIFDRNGLNYKGASLTGSLAWPSGVVAVGDIDGDGEGEIGLISKSGTSRVYPEFREVRFWNLDGTTCPGWPISLPRSNDFVPSTLAPTVIDIDGDEVGEVIFSSVVSKGGLPRLHLVRGNGMPVNGWPRTLQAANDTFIHSTTGVADIDGDGAIDIVVADSKGGVHVLHLSGQYHAGWPKTVASGTHIAQEVALSDLDRDGRTEIICTFYSGTVAVLDQTGTMKPGWPRNLGQIPRPPAIADLDGDGDLELAIGTQTGLLHVMHHDGADLPGWPKVSSSRFYSPTLADLNGDGNLDVIASDGNLTLYAWSSDGTPFTSLGFPYRLPGTFGCYSPPVVEDLDGDGLLELVVTGDDLEVLNMSAVANPRVQPFSHMHVDPANTCRYVLPAVPQKGQRFLVDRSSGGELDLNGSGFMAGSTFRIGATDAALAMFSSESVALSVPQNLTTGWNDLRISHPDTGDSWLANAVLVVEDRFGDTDGDALPDEWEWRHGFDLLRKEKASSDFGALGDLDRDGLVNLVEAAFEAAGLDPGVPDADLCPQIKVEGDKVFAEYPVSLSSRMTIEMAVSENFSEWMLPSELGYPSVLRDELIDAEGGDERVRELELERPQSDSAFFRWNVEGPPQTDE